MVMMVQDVPRVGRKLRKPSHTFVLKTKPFQIQPFMIAPVLPGETMKSLLLQSRVVTDPIKHALIGWWKEYYFFYVKHRDLKSPVTDQDSVQAQSQNMMIDLEASTADLVAGASVAAHYELDDNVAFKWLSVAMVPIIEHYFREEGEAYGAATIAGLPAAAINGESWLQSAYLESALETGGDLGDLETAAEDVTLRELDQALRQYELLRAQRLTDMSYEEFLKTYGIRGKLVEKTHRPELIRYVRDWTYPSNAVDFNDGSVASACSWAVTERADKDRFFAEPGFIIGVTVARPKVYNAKQKAYAAQWLNNAFMWLPAIMRGDPSTSLKRFSGTEGPLAGNVGGAAYWADMRDLFVYGDQFANYDLDAATDGTNAIDLPTATLGINYPTEAMVDALFAADTAENIREDGIVTLNILSTEQDQTP